MPTAKDKQRVMVTLTAQQVERLDAIADETGVSRSGTVSLALSQWLRGWAPPETAQHEFTFVVRDEYDPNRDPDEVGEDIELDVRLPSREDAVMWAWRYSIEHKRVGLHVDWIYESDETDTMCGSVPIGDYRIRGCKPSEVVWDD